MPVISVNEPIPLRQGPFRLRRPAAPPFFVARQQRDGRRRKWRVVETSDPNTLLEVNVSGWAHIGESPVAEGEPNRPWVKRQRIFCWLKRDDVRIGAAELFRYKTSEWISNDWLLEIMDRDSGYEAKFGEILSLAFNDVYVDLFDFGYVTEFTSMWIDQPETSLRLARNVFHRLLDAYSAKAAMTFIRAFPLEYEGAISDHESYEIGYRNRLRVMKDILRTRFRFNEIIGDDLPRNWMCRSRFPIQVLTRRD